MLAAVNTSESKAKPSGNLTVIDLASRAIEKTCDLGGQPDSIAVSKDGAFAAIAIENERDEELNDGEIPQLPAGNLKIVPLSAGVPDCDGIKTVDLTGIAAVAPEDPEPEFVAFNEAERDRASRCRKTTTSRSSTRRAARSSRISRPAASRSRRSTPRRMARFPSTARSRTRCASRTP